MKKLLVLSLVLLLGVTCMAKTNFFDNLFIKGDVEVEGTVTFADIDIVGDLGLTGNFTADGTVHSIDGSTSIALITAALNITGDSFITGDITQTGSTTITGDLAVDGTSNLDEVDIDSTVQIDGTVTGGVSGTAYTWIWHSDSADDNMTWTDSTACLTLTGIDTTDVLTVADGNVSITDDLDVNGISNFDVVDIDDDVTQVGDYYLTGNMTQTGSTTITADLAVDGTSNLDNTDIDGTFDLTGTTALLTCSTSVINYTPIFTFGYDVGAATTFTTTDGTGAVAITMAGTSTDVTWAADSMTLTTAFEIAGASIFDSITAEGTFLYTGNTTQTGSITLLGADGDINVADDADIDGDLDVAGTTNLNVVDIDDAVDIAGAVTQVGNYYITGDITQTGSTTITADLAVDGVANLDVTDVQGALTVGTFDFSVDTDDFVVDVDGDISIMPDLDIVMTPTGGDILIIGDTTQTGSITATSDITTSGGNFVMGSITITETEIGYLDGLTPGTVTANKAVVVDGSKDIATFGSITAGTFTDGTAILTSGDLTGLTSLEITGNITQTGSTTITVDLSVDGTTNLDVTDVQGALTVGAFDFSVDTTDFVVDIDGNISMVPQLDIVMTPTGSDILITGDITQTGSTTITGDLAVDGTANLDATDIDDTLNVQGITTFQANTTVATATNAGGIYVSMYDIVHTQTASLTILTLPANSDIIDVVVIIQTAFNGGGTDLLNVGTQALADAYVDDLDIEAPAVHRTGDAQMLYANLGDVGGSSLDVKALYTDEHDDASTGAATIYVYWTMGTAGSLP